MASRDIYERGFDEDDGRTIAAACPECDSALETDGGETSCTVCGLIVERYYIDHAAAPLDFPGDGISNEQTGPPLTPARHDRGLSSEIGYKRDSRGNTLSGQKRRQLSRLRREHSRSRFGSTAEQNLAKACLEIDRLCSALELSKSVCEEACTLYRRAHTASLIQGRSIESIASACLYAVCRKREYPLTLDDIVAVGRCDRQALTTGYGVLQSTFELVIPPRPPQAFLPRIASEAGVPPDIESEARRLAVALFESGFGGGSNPVGIAAACLEIACREANFDVTQQALAEAAGITAMTVRNQRDRIRERFDDGRLRFERSRISSTKWPMS